MNMQAWKNSIKHVVYDGGSIQQIELRSSSRKKLRHNNMRLKMTATGELTNADDTINTE